MLDLPEKSWNLWEKIINPETNIIYKIILIFTAISYFFKHPRTRYKAIICFLFFSLVIVLYHFRYLNTPIYLTLPLIYGAISFYIAKKEPFPLLKGKRFKDYFEEIKGKSPIESYKILDSIDEKNLYHNEIEILNRKKIYFLLFLGDIERAEEISKRIKDQENPKYLLDRARMLELQGDIKESELLLKKCTTLKIEDPVLKTSIYNNYARICRLKNNYSDAIFYFTQAKKIIEENQVKDKDLINNIYSNLIENYCIIKEYSNMEKMMLEYREKLDFTDKEDMNSLFNLELNISRQMEVISEVEEFSREMYKKVIQKLSLPDRLKAQASTLRYSYNSGYNIEYLLDDVETSIEEYNKQKMPLKFYLFKELKIVVLSPEKTFRKEKYPKTIQAVKNYYFNEAKKDLENYYSSLEVEQVFDRAETLNNLIEVLKTTEEYDSEKVISKMEEVINIYEKNNLYTKMIEQRLNMIDECINEKNIEQTRYGGIYFYKIRILENLEKFTEEIKKIENNPEAPSFYLRAAYYYLSQNKKDKAKIYYEKFKLTGVSIDHYAIWLKKYDEILENFLS